MKDGELNLYTTSISIASFVLVTSLSEIHSIMLFKSSNFGIVIGEDIYEFEVVGLTMTEERSLTSLPATVSGVAENLTLIYLAYSTLDLIQIFSRSNFALNSVTAGNFQMDFIVNPSFTNNLSLYGATVNGWLKKFDVLTNTSTNIFVISAYEVTGLVDVGNGVRQLIMTEKNGLILIWDEVANLISEIDILLNNTYLFGLCYDTTNDRLGLVASENNLKLTIWDYTISVTCHSSCSTCDGFYVPDVNLKCTACPADTPS